MAKAKIPVSVGGIEFDALIDEERTLEAQIPEYVVDDGFVVSDAVIFNPEHISMTLFVTDTPVTWRGSHGGKGWTERICNQLEQQYYKGEPVTIVTTDRTYQNMCIETLTFRKSAEIGYAREIPITFKQIRKTTIKTSTIPDWYGKSGSTQQNNGSANTGTGSSGNDGSSGSGGSGNSDGANDGSSNSSNGSILHGIASGAGLI